jgi:8-oxo-dGTP pyrophosphatase MutT (NUDIX family)
MSSPSFITFESNYFFPQVFAVKALIHDGAGKFVFLTEPETSSWKPGRLGLPGGKIDSGEDWLTALHRELREELELTTEATPEGFLSLEEIVLINPKTGLKQITHHLIVVCHLSALSQQLVSNAQWYSLAELRAKKIDELTEYYFPALFDKIEQGIDRLAPLSFIHVMNGIQNQPFQDWFLK